MTRSAWRLTLFPALFLACALVVGGGCQAPAGPGLYVTIRAEPKKGYRPPTGPDGEAFSYGATVEPAQPQAAAPQPGFDLIEYRRLAGIIVWVEPVEMTPTTAAPAPDAPPPLDAAVKLSMGQQARYEDVYLASVGGRVSLGATSAKLSDFIVRTEAGEMIDVPTGQPVFVPSKPRLVEILSPYDEGDQPLAQVYVAPTARARKVRGGDRIRFAPLTPGRYRVTTWHPILPGSSQVVEVTPGKPVNVTLTVGVNALPKARGTSKQ